MFHVNRNVEMSNKNIIIKEIILMMVWDFVYICIFLRMVVMTFYGIVKSALDLTGHQ
jgi:hypothetical protein